MTKRPVAQAGKSRDPVKTAAKNKAAAARAANPDVRDKKNEASARRASVSNSNLPSKPVSVYTTPTKSRTERAKEAVGMGSKPKPSTGTYDRSKVGVGSKSGGDSSYAAKAKSAAGLGGIKRGPPTSTRVIKGATDAANSVGNAAKGAAGATSSAIKGMLNSDAAKMVSEKVQEAAASEAAKFGLRAGMAILTKGRSETRRSIRNAMKGD